VNTEPTGDLSKKASKPKKKTVTSGEFFRWQGGQQQWNQNKSGDQQQGWTQNQQWTPKGKKQGGKQNWNQKGQWNWRARVVITVHSFMISPVYVEQPGTLFL